MTLNRLGYHVLNENMLQAFMGNVKPIELDAFSELLINQELEGFNIKPGEHTNGVEFDDSFWTPPMLADNVKDHFELMAGKFLDKHGLNEKLSKLQLDIGEPLVLSDEVIEQTNWCAGWNRFDTLTGEHSTCWAPLEPVFVEDTETFVRGSHKNMPIMATAVSPKASYIWLSPQLLEAWQNLATIAKLDSELYKASCRLSELTIAKQPIADAKAKLAELEAELEALRAKQFFDQATAPYVPIGRNKLVIQHNSGFDGPRCDERFEMHFGSNSFILDTMSMSMPVNGLCGGQRWVTRSKNPNKPLYAQKGTGKSLAANWTFHVGQHMTPAMSWAELGSEGDKSLRAIFVKADSLMAIAKRMNELLRYAMNDSYRTWQLAAALIIKYRQAMPSQVSIASHLMLASSVIPVANDWPEWTERCEQMYKNALRELDCLFLQLAKEHHQAWQKDKTCMANDPWLKSLDWRVGHTDADGQDYANWYIALHKTNITPKKELAHQLLKLRWRGSPIVKIKKPEAKGYCFEVTQRVIDSNNFKQEMKAVMLANQLTEELQPWEIDGYGITLPKAGDFRDESGKLMRKLPHKDGQGKNVGAVLTKFYHRFLQNGRITGCSASAEQILNLQKQITFWTGYRERILSAHVRKRVNPLTGEPINLLAPAVVPHNTVSYRTGEALYLTLAARGTPRIGSEIKAKSEAPEGYALVWFDYDSQELAVLSAFADSYYKLSGATAFTNAVLAGSKQNKTDMHSAVATDATRAANYAILRDAAKQAVYAMCYGAMAKTVANTLCMWHGDLPFEQAKQFSRPLIEAFKGVRPKGVEYYAGGRASHAFNKMHDILKQERPATPVLSASMPPAMWPEYYGKIDAPDQLNWTVQSSGSSMLFATIVAAWYLADLFQIKASFAISVHDELVFYCEKQYAELFAFLLQVAHAWTWCLLHYNLGIYDMPTSRAYATGIAIGKYWRKSAKQPIATPSSPIEPLPDTELGMRQLVGELHLDQLAKERYELLYQTGL